MREIVESLNDVGHKLKENPPDELPDYSETDYCENHGEKNCGFRIGSSIVISSGYYGANDFDKKN